MSHKTRGRIRMLFAVPSALVLAFGATELLASPPATSRAPDCGVYCDVYAARCEINPTYGYCVWCGCTGGVER